MAKAKLDKKEMFESMPVPKALTAMAVPTIISQLITLIYNMVDAFFIGQTGNSYMVASISLTLTLVIMLTSLSNLFGVGGGSLSARLMGVRQDGECRRVSAFSVYGAIAVALTYSLLIGVFKTNVYATVIPLLFPRIGIAFRPMIDRKRGVDTTGAEGSDLID